MANVSGMQLMRWRMLSVAIIQVKSHHVTSKKKEEM